RQSTVPMDFEYENKTGPINESSPFLQAAAKKQGIELTSGPLHGQPGPHSVLDSPSKNGFSAPDRFQLRDPNNQDHYLFNQPDKPLPAVPSRVRNNPVWEPRTPPSVVDFSSGGETPNTPANDDSEAGTPDTQLRNKMGGLLSERKSKSPVKRRESWLGRFMSSSSSPSKESRDRDRDRDRDRERDHLYSKKAEHRIMKKRAKSRKVASRDDYDSDDENTPHRERKTQLGGPGAQHVQPGMAARLGSLFTFIEAHPHLPSVLSFYLQLLINTALGMFFLYILYRCYRAVLNDIDLESRNNMIGVIADIKACAKEYTDNRCDPQMRVPAMAKLCQTWENCMSRDPQKAAAATVTAKTFAMIFNAFVEEFSYKSMIFSAIILFGGFNISNWAFGLFRQKQESHIQQHHPSQHMNFPPATPQRYPSNGY
ncbi:Di-sulfide bridge nucleocytoplasmic transport domain-domain-containing protein, partial [Clohesyomyces aquaticus]